MSVKRDSVTGFVLMGIAAFLFLLQFNRDVKRNIGDGVVSPTDGTVEKIDGAKIDVFIGLFDMHIQFAPVSGYVQAVTDEPEQNRNTVTINGISIERKGGILARSVITYVKSGQYVEKGQPIGKILLGSHVSVYPVQNPVVKVGQKIKAGERIA